MFVTFGPDIDGGVVLSGHTDVVPVIGQKWTTPPFVLRRDGERLYGRGTCDMKGFDALCLAMARISRGEAQKADPHHAEL